MPSDRGRLRRYGFACGVTFCAALLTPMLRPYLVSMPSAPLAAAVLASAWYGGVGPGLLAFLIMLVTASRVLPAPPEATLTKTLTGLGFFLLITVLLGWQSSAGRRARATLRLLADAGESLTASLDYPTTLTTTARLAVPALADACLVDLIAEDGGLCCASAAHADPLLENKLRLAAQCLAPAAGGPGGVAAAVRSGETLTYPRLSDALLKDVVPEEPRRQALRALGVRSLLIVPLRAHGQTIGALTLVSTRRGLRYRRADQLTAGELARRAALAIENARLYREARDMEEALRRRAEQLTLADRNKDEFLAVVAHELRGPLAALRNALEVVRHHGPGAPPAEAPQGIMTRQVETLARLVDDLLDVAGIAQGKIALRRQSIDLTGPLQSALDTARPLLDGRRHTLTVTLPRDGLRVEGDPLRLVQVFANLLTNAAKYTEPGGHVWLSAAVEDCADGLRQAVVSVRDSGVGMAPDFLAHAFDLFAQGPEALGRSQGGLGIGLALVRRLVEMHGGAVEAHSDGPGRGSEFVVRLPLAQEPGANVTPTADPQCAIPVPQSRRVLVVDDNKDAAETLALLLRLRGHDVIVAADGPAALALAVDYLPDVVLLDLGLPGMGGHEVGRRLRRQPGLDKARVVALTGSGSEEDRGLSFQAGFDAHVVKPVDPADLDRLLSGAG
jgi:signal transduction histidine kinase/CheY-like chemotaxis protein